MKITQIRNATQIIYYAGQRLLVDPMLSPQGTYPGFEGTSRPEIRIPTVDLPLAMEQILAVDAVIVTHTHLDHWDDAAIALIPKDKTIFVQNSRDAALLASQGFTQLVVMTDHTTFGDITLSKTDVGQHGSERAYTNPQLAERMGDACGVVLRHPDEPTLYLAGDTVWRAEVEEFLVEQRPDVVVLNAGDAHVIGFGAIIMGKHDVLKAHLALPEARIVATHLEAVNHCLLSRAELRQYVADNQIAGSVLIPQDGETLTF